MTSITRAATPPGVRVLHFADAHLGFESYGRLDPATGLSTRIHDVLDRLDEIVAFVAAHEVDLVCFAGDAFRSSRPSPTLETLFAERVRAMAEAGAAVVLVAGDHDRPRVAGHRGPLDIYTTLGPPRVHVATEATVLGVPTRAGRVAVACVPEGAASGSTMAGVVDGLASQIGTGVPALLVAHVGLAEASVSPSQAQFGLPEREPPLPVAAVAHPRFPYVALGHVHRHQGDLHGARPFVAYSGGVERVDFGEEGEAKGFYVVDLEGDSLAGPPEFVPLRARPFRTIEVSLADEEPEPLGVVRERVAARAPGAIVRVRLDGPRHVLAQLRPADVAGLVEEAATVRVEMRVRRPPRMAIAPQLAGAESEQAALDAWLSAQPDLPDRDLIRARGRHLIADVLGPAPTGEGARGAA